MKSENSSETTVAGARILTVCGRDFLVCIQPENRPHHNRPVPPGTATSGPRCCYERSTHWCSQPESSRFSSGTSVKYSPAPFLYGCGTMMMCPSSSPLECKYD
ncbi:Piso0_000178 [Millerozyma farinosa CBS 7064]|uniref:Piso0_000178 protein n=1 Tax=Pichia sorbitophila (strain ATCC MYA-4447 / BCRC 22081 / CBS 7064 / NBRC 10061 / NRRL Y-12695) TaxID=559304 RepID=G8YUQ8_PICSO|nr:Piso0_000178 [Millerozyma farinosa CBS 7064]